MNLTRAADIKSIAINITSPGQTITATLGDGMMCGPFPAIYLYDPAELELGVDFADEADEECAALVPGFHAFASNLVVGTHQLALANFGGAPGPVDVQVGVINPACGNGIL